MKFVNTILFAVIILISGVPTQAMFRTATIQLGLLNRPNIDLRQPISCVMQRASGFKISNKKIKEQVHAEIADVLDLFHWDKKPNYTCKLNNGNFAMVELFDKKRMPVRFSIPNTLHLEPEDIRKFVYAHEIGHVQQHMTHDQEYDKLKSLNQIIYNTRFDAVNQSLFDEWVKTNHHVEFDADKRAVLALRCCSGAIARLNSHIKRNPAAQQLSFTHPTPFERIARLEQLRKEIGLL